MSPVEPPEPAVGGEGGDGANGAPSSFTGRVETVPMDGNCLFTAAFRELVRLKRQGTVASVAVLRDKIVTWVLEHGGDTECAELTLSQWIALETDEGLEEYCVRMRQNGQWGGIVELYAFAEIFDVRTCVYEPAGKASNGKPLFVRRHALESTLRAKPSGKEAAAKTSDAASVPLSPPPHAHLHYNGTSHYSVFVPDEVPGHTVSDGPMPSASTPAAHPSVGGAKTSVRAQSSRGGGGGGGGGGCRSGGRQQGVAGGATVPLGSVSSGRGGGSSSSSGAGSSGADGLSSKRPCKSVRSPTGASSARTLSVGAMGSGRGGSSSRSGSNSQRLDGPSRRRVAPPTQATSLGGGGLRLGALPPTARHSPALHSSSARRRVSLLASSSAANTSSSALIGRQLASMRTGGHAPWSSSLGLRTTVPREVRV